MKSNFNLCLGARALLFLAAIGFFTANLLAAPIAAFPGAEGFAACSVGGRGGDVYTVTNLEASGPGSFANGINTVPPQGRTIVFAVSGYIPIHKLRLKNSNVTIAGQTAPGDGVGLRGSSFWISGNDVVVRFLRFRHGKDGNGGDALDTDNGAARLMLDHCDALFSIDENFSMFRTAPPTMTFQWSINAWGLQHHSAGGLWLVDHATAHHTLWADNHTRNPKCIKPVVFDWVNNVTFGWDFGFNLAGADVPGSYHTNIRGSWFIHGGKMKRAIIGGGKSPGGSVSFGVYMNDCALDGNGDGILNVSATDYEMLDAPDYVKEPMPFSLTATPGDTPVGLPIQVDDRLTAFKKIVSQVGPLRMDVNPELPLRDEVDTLLIKDLVTQNRRIISSEAELGLPNAGFGTLVSEAAPTDSDGDGMPDFWEKALGWNPNADDHNTELASNKGILSEPGFFPPQTSAGYTRLEEYLHFLAIPHGTVAKNVGSAADGVRVDLRKFTSGFTTLPVYKITDPIGGTVTQSGDGGSIATFTPTLNYTGRAKFDFTVTDNDGSTWKQTCALLVIEK